MNKDTEILIEYYNVIARLACLRLARATVEWDGQLSLLAGRRGRLMNI